MTTHQIFYKNANVMAELPNDSIDLMITSPPYPMVVMWDEIFSKENEDIAKAIKSEKGDLAFELMHKELDKVWDETFRVLKPGGIACINIGDATRTINKDFKLYNSHSRITNYCLNKGFSNLPNIIWHKQTNSPNKFMGSGMLPVGAYVTLEHEYILIFRKGKKREFTSEEDKNNRMESSYFWEERNLWFSDIWYNLKGIKQDLNDQNLRKRSAAYPFDFAYRLINMFSVKGDTVLDPYLGTGTTTLAAIASERNSVGYEIDSNFKNHIDKRIDNCADYLNNYIYQRLENHKEFLKERKKKEKINKYINKNLNLEVVTKQESEINFKLVDSIKIDKNSYKVLYKKKI